MSAIPLASTAELERSQRLCSEILGEAVRLSSRRPVGAAFIQLLDRASDVLDDIDEVLLALHMRRDHPAFVDAADLHRRFETCLEALPPPLRGNLRRARRVTDF